MKLLTNVLIAAYGIKCLIGLATSPTIYDGIFFVTCITYFALQIDILYPEDSK